MSKAKVSNQNSATVADDDATKVTKPAADSQPGKTLASPTAEPAKEEGPAQAQEPAEERDPWEAFTPVVPKAPGMVERTVDRVVDAADRFVRSEPVLASAGALLAAAAMTWPVLRHPTTALPAELSGPGQDAWRMAWLGHSLTTRPAGIWQSNLLHPGRNSFALLGSLFGYAPAAAIGTGQSATILRYNLLFVFAFALATIGGYALARQVGAGRLASTVAAVAFGYAPWRLGQAAHLEALSVGGVALSLAMLARGHGWSMRDGRQPARNRPLWAVAGWLVAAWQISLGPGVGVPFGYLLGVGALVLCAGCLIRALLRRKRPAVSLRMLLIDTTGAIVCGALVTGLVLLNQWSLRTYPEAHTTAKAIAPYSPPLRGFITAPAASLLWGGSHVKARAALANPSAMAVLPGFFLYALALAGLVFSIWTVRQRIFLFVGAVVSAVLAMGTAGPDHGWVGFRALYRVVPGFAAVRTPNWLVAWVSLLLAILAAGALCSLSQRIHAATVRIASERRRVWTNRVLRVALLIPLALVAAEGLPHYAVAAVAKPPTALRGVRGPVLVLPSDPTGDTAVMVWSTRGFLTVANGSGMVTPTRLARVRTIARSFPDSESVQAIHELGVQTVIVLRAQATRAGYAVMAPGGLDEDLMAEFGLTVRETPDTIVFTLD